jgi:FtsH-binding integral membrane protein
LASERQDRLWRRCTGNFSSDTALRSQVLGLYLNFVNLFQLLLSLLGSRDE